MHREGRTVLQHLLQEDQPRGAIVCAACEPWALGVRPVLCPLSSQKYARYENMLPTGLCYVGGGGHFHQILRKMKTSLPFQQHKASVCVGW